MSLVLCLYILASLLPAGASAADARKGENCRDLSRDWFSDNPSTELRLPEELVPRKSARSMAGVLDRYFESREECWNGNGETPRKSARDPAPGSSLSGAVALFEERAGLTVTDASLTAVYDNEHIFAREDGSYTVFVYEWVFFDYDDLTDSEETTDVSGCGFSHKIVLRPAGGGYEIASDEYDASDLLGICTLNDSTKRELEQMNWVPAETGDGGADGTARETAYGPGRKSVFYSRYSQDACAAYADRYVYNKAQGGTVYESYYNKAYANYNSVGGDCANYTSQCISAGGMPQVKGTPYGTDGWYYSSAHDRSGTWTYVPYLRDWMAANRGVKRAASDSTVWKGSPVFYGDQHAVICVGWNSAGVPVINSHNNDWYHVKWNYYDPGNVTTVQLTPSPEPGPWPGKPVLEPFDRSVESGKSVVFRWDETYTVTHYNLYVDAMRADGTWDRNRQVRNYAQSGETMRLPDGVYRVMLQAVNAEEEDWPWTNSDTVVFAVGSHDHSRGEQTGKASKHPHHIRWRCAECGEVWTDGDSVAEAENCPVCQRPGKPALSGPQGAPADDDPVRFSWEPVSKATSYRLFIDRRNADGSWQAGCLETDTAECGCTVRPGAGSYRARLRAVNARCALEDGSGWVSTDADAVLFTVGRTEKIVFDPAGGAFSGAIRSETADRVDNGWSLDELSVFTEEGQTVKTGDSAVEAAVDAFGLVIGKRDPGGAHLTVPEGGFVLAAGGDGVFPKTAFVKAIMPGDHVGFDRESLTAYQYQDTDAWLSHHKRVLPSSEYGCLPVPKREGYYFNGWLDAEGQPAGSGSVCSSALLTASWADDDTGPAQACVFEGHLYERYEYPMSWQDAERFCEERGGHLAVITSPEEQGAAVSLACGWNAYYYIGCSAQDGSGTWSWVTGEDFPGFGNTEPFSPELTEEDPFGAMTGRMAGQGKAPGEWTGVPDLPSYPSDAFHSCGFICEYDTAPVTGHEHEYTGSEIPPSCEKEGYAVRRCSCGETLIEVIPAAGHEYAAEVTAPSCTLPGFTSYTCSRCGDSYSGDGTSVLGHDYAGGRCTRCGTAQPGYVPPPDLTELNTVTAGAFRIQLEGFTFRSIDVLEAALEQASAAASSGSQQEIDAAARAVREAVDGLEPVPDRLFRDVMDSGRYYYDPVYWAFRSKPRITNGFYATEFAPDMACTRAQVVTFLWRAARCPEPKSTESTFRDVKSGAFYEKAVAWAVEKGITNGGSRTGFAPDAPCTRAQIVTFLWRFSGSADAGGTAASFTDIQPGAYYTRAIAWAVENGVTKGMRADAFGPDAGCTRAQAVTFLYRAEKGK